MSARINKTFSDNKKKLVSFVTGGDPNLEISKKIINTIADSGVDIIEILIGILIFFVFLIFRGLISKLIIKRLEGIAKKTTNKFDDTFVKLERF